MIEPPIVIECPVCGEKYLVSRKANSPSEQATRYSDGYYTDIHNWRTPEIIGCVTCDLGFFPENGKIIALPNWTEFNEQWSHLKKAESPTAGSLVLDLRARKQIDLQQELPIRKEFWYASNHTETGRILLRKNEKFKLFYTESLMRLEQIIGTETENALLLKAEINRQLGNFDTCITLLAGNKSLLALSITDRAQKGIPNVFEW